VNKNTTVDTFIDDPTEEQHIPKALAGIRILAERLSGDKSLDDLFAHVRSCAADIRSDPDTKTWFDEFFAHARKTLEEPSYGHSEEASRKGDFLRQRWNELLDADSDKGRKWKVDVEALRNEIDEFQARAANDQSLNRLRAAHGKLGQDMGEAFATAGSVGIQAAMSQSTWMLQDVLNVYLPRTFGMFKGSPIPRRVLQFYYHVYVSNLPIFLGLSTRMRRPSLCSRTFLWTSSHSCRVISTSGTSPTLTSLPTSQASQTRPLVR
jgi:hypothetical protein